MSKFKVKNLQFTNYNEETSTNNKLDNVSQILVYQDKKNTIFLTVNNAAPFDVYLVNTYHSNDWEIIDQLGSVGLQDMLKDYLGK